MPLQRPMMRAMAENEALKAKIAALEAKHEAAEGTLAAEIAAFKASATAGVAEIGTGAAMSGEALPRGWTAHATSEGQAYYYNSATGVTEWARPQAAAQVDAGLLHAGTVTSV